MLRKDKKVLNVKWIQPYSVGVKLVRLAMMVVCNKGRTPRVTVRRVLLYMGPIWHILVLPSPPWQTKLDFDSWASTAGVCLLQPTG